MLGNGDICIELKMQLTFTNWLPLRYKSNINLDDLPVVIGRLLKKCQEGSSIRKKAVSLVKTLIKTVDAMLSKNGSSNGKDRLCVVLKKIKNDVSWLKAK